MHQYDIALLELYAYGKCDLNKKGSFYADEHGLLESSIDLDLILGVLNTTNFEFSEGSLESDIFQGYDYCLHYILQRSVCYDCEICANINDFLKHSSACKLHPSICPLCRTSLNLFTYHLNKHGLTCGLIICEKLYLSLKKDAIETLLNYWPKIQNSILSLIYPRPITKTDIKRCFATVEPSHNIMSAQKLFAPRSVNNNHDSGDELVPKGPAEGTSSSSDEFPRMYNQGQAGMTCALIDGLDNIKIEPPARPGNWESDGPMSGFSTVVTAPLLFPKPAEADGCGRVINGEPRQLEKLSNFWQDLKHLYRSSHCLESLPHRIDGVLLNGMPHRLRAVDGLYEEFIHWDRLSTPIGSGAHGEVYIASDKATGDHFALKQVPLTKFQQDELIMWMKLEHDNIVQLYGALRVNQYIYILSELYTGGSLQEFIKQNIQIDQWSATYFLQQIFYALEHLKEINILHEDLKADNIFMKAGSWKIALGDFGLSRHAPVGLNQSPIGAAMTWSPEKAGSFGHSFSSDLWAATCVYIHMLAGNPPWIKRCGNLPSLIYVIVSKSPPLEDVPAGLIDEIVDLIQYGLAPQPDDRKNVEQLLTHQAFQILGLDRDDPRWTGHFGSGDSTPEISTDFAADIEMTGSAETDESLRELTNQIIADLPAESQSRGREYLNQLIAEITPSELNMLDDQQVPSLDDMQTSADMSSVSNINPYLSDFSMSQSTGMESASLQSIQEEDSNLMGAALGTGSSHPFLHLDIQSATQGSYNHNQRMENFQRSQTVLEPGARRHERPLRRSQTSPIHAPLSGPFAMVTPGDNVFTDTDEGDILVGERNIFSLDTASVSQQTDPLHRTQHSNNGANAARRDTGYGTSSPRTG